MVEGRVVALRLPFCIFVNNEPFDPIVGLAEPLRVLLVVIVATLDEVLQKSLSQFNHVHNCTMVEWSASKEVRPKRVVAKWTQMATESGEQGP